MQRHVEIAGAGFAGLAVATAFCQRGWSARVHEASPELRALGAGIFIWENGLRVLAELGAYRDVVTGAHEAPGYEGRNAANERISMETFGPHRKTRMLTMTRQHLYTAMLTAATRAGVEVIANSQVLAADPRGELTTTDGKRWRGDLVVGADGVASNVRRSLGRIPKVTPCDFGVIRLLLNRGEHDLPFTDGDNVINFWSPNHRILYVPCNRNDLYLAMGARDTDKASTAIPVSKEIWSDAFPQLTHIVERIGASGRYDTYETSVLDKWSVGRAVLVGDSAHAMPPTLGQGAGCALMNALSLAEMVAEAPRIDDALLAWERNERPLTDHTQQIAARYAATHAGRDGTSKWDDAALRAARHVPLGAHATTGV
jgi:2-methyl-3-hydroxypyridine 5-carboxylic acid dioxygenase